MIIPMTLSFTSEFTSWWSKFFGAVTSINSITDILDILFVAVIFYGMIIMLRKSQSIQIIKGVLLVILLYILVSVLQMSASKFLFDNVISNILVILVIIFSKEIRQVLERLGQGKNLKNFSFFSDNKSDNDTVDAINAVCRACGQMSDDKVGSLIIFQRKSLLGDLMKQSVPIDSQTTYEMLLSIFFPKAALHDGAIIINEGRIVAARCVVPLRNEKEIYDHVGTRHRAALEVSLMSDAVVVVTSEETGIISIAYDGQLVRDLTDSELRSKLSDLILPHEKDDKSKSKKSPVKRLKGGKKE